MIPSLRTPSLAFGLGLVIAVGCAKGGAFIDDGSGGEAGATTTTTSSSRPTDTTSTTTGTDSTTTTTTDTTSTTKSGTTTSSTTTSTSTSTTSTTTTTTTPPTGCTQITAANFQLGAADGTVGVFITNPSPNSGASEADRFGLELYGSAFDPSLNGEAKGTFNLASGGDSNYASCSRCVRMVEDPTLPGRTFFQTGGTLTIASSSDQLNGSISATLTNVTLVEVTVDASTFVSTPVPGGACVHLNSATINVTGTGVPATWSCDPDYYGDGYCDCGCGAFDVMDCFSQSYLACDFCDDLGSCSSSSCPGSISSTNNATCGP